MPGHLEKATRVGEAGGEGEKSILAREEGRHDP